MKTLPWLAVIAMTVTLVSYSASAALPDYEPFANATGSGGTSYTTGANLIGQTDASGQSWTQAGPNSAVQPTIAAGDLTIPGLYSAGGGQSVLFGGNGTSARFNIGSTISSGTIYYSFSMRLTDLTGLSSSGVFWAGLNNSTGTQTTTPNTVDTRVVTKTGSTAGTYNIGLDKSSGTAANFVFSSTDYTTNDTILIVGSYTFLAGATNNDVSQLWVNPNSSTFGGSDPLGALVNTNGTDIGSIASFVLFDRNSGEPAGGLIDDLRVGTSYADVTTPTPEPSTVALGTLALVGFGVWRLRRKSR